VDERLGEALVELIERTDHDIPLSDLFVKLLCGELQPTGELLCWCGERSIEVERTGPREFTFRKAALRDGLSTEGAKVGEFVRALFDF